MVSTAEAFAALEARFVAWAAGVDDIRAVMVVGSRARARTPADEWSDLDLVVITTDPARYSASEDWLAALGAYWVTFTEPTNEGEIERRVLFEGGLDVDFVPISPGGLKQANQAPEIPDVVRRGVRVLLDKDGALTAVTEGLPSSVLATPAEPPSLDRFRNVVNDFWYHTVWTAKKLRRSERWTAMACLDSYLKRNCLLPMIEWHAGASFGWEIDTWHGGRFLEQWADPRVIEALRGTFSHYDDDDMWAALFATMALFRWLSAETANRLGYAYPDAAAEKTTVYVQALYAQRQAD